MSLAADTREAVFDHPFLHDALRAGIVNYAAAARALDVSDDTEAVATALRRFADSLPDRERRALDARVSMESGLAAGAADPLVSVGGATYGADGGDYTGLVASGEVDPEALGHVLSVLRVNEVPVEAAAVAGDALVVVVERRAGATALRLVESALDGVPE